MIEFRLLTSDICHLPCGRTIKQGDVKMSNRKQDRSAADFAAGAILAMTLFAGLVALGTAISGIPDCARGLAVMSAKLNVIATETESPDAPKQPASVSPRAAGELIRLSGFGGQDIEAAPEETEDPPSDEESPGELPYPEKAEHSDGKIVRKTYTYHPSTTYLELPGGGLLRNCTDIDPQYLLEQCAREPDIELHEKGEPLVLIMHTHTTESYEPVIRGYYDASFSSRTTELDKSVAEVGARIAEELSAAGIGVIHDTTVHDYPQYTGAYDRSAVTVEGYLEGRRRNRGEENRKPRFRIGVKQLLPESQAVSGRSHVKPSVPQLRRRQVDGKGAPLCRRRGG